MWKLIVTRATEIVKAFKETPNYPNTQSTLAARKLLCAGIPRQKGGSKSMLMGHLKVIQAFRRWRCD